MHRALLILIGLLCGTGALAQQSALTLPLQPGANLSDLAAIATARTNLGVGDYAVGTVTPTLGATTTAPTGVTYATQSGTYVRIGRLVLVTGRMALTSAGTGGAGIATIAGLPFAASVLAPVTPFRASGVTLPASSILGGLVAGSTIQLQSVSSSGAADVAIGSVSGTADFIFSLAYMSP